MTKLVNIMSMMLNHMEITSIYHYNTILLRTMAPPAACTLILLDAVATPEAYPALFTFNPSNDSTSEKVIED